MKLYRCAVCQKEFTTDLIMSHMSTHDEFWHPKMDLGKTVDDYQQRFTPLGLALEEVDLNSP